MSRPAAQPRPDRTDAILAAALETFGRQGFAEANLDEIAQKAGVAKPTLYNRFGDKRSLFVEAMKRGMGRSNDRILKVIQSIDVRPGDLRGELERLGHALVHCVASSEGAAVVRLLIAELTHFPELEAEDHRERHIDALAGKFAQLATTGYLSLADPQRAARQFMALVTADALAESRYGRRVLGAEALKEPVSAGVDTFLAAFGPSEKSPGAGSPSARPSRARSSR